MRRSFNHILVLLLTAFFSLYAKIGLCQFPYSSNTRDFFEENKGQVRGQDAYSVKYFHKAGNLTIFLMEDGISYQFNKYSPTSFQAIDEPLRIRRADSSNSRLETFRMNLKFIEYNPNYKIIEDSKSTDYSNYYNYGALDVHHFKKITYQNIYPNIDWVVYFTDNDIKYDFVVNPKGDPSSIKLIAEWVENLHLNEHGNLVMSNNIGKIEEMHPLSMQLNQIIPSHFQLIGDTISFVIDHYQTDQTLIIDPLIKHWSTYYGSPDGVVNAYSTRTDGLGNVFMCGGTSAQTHIANDGYQDTLTGDYDAFITKFSADGQRIWSTYFGGTLYDAFSDCATNTDNEVFAFGSTGSTDIITLNAHQDTSGGGGFYDTYIVKLSEIGNLIWSSYCGGEKHDFADRCATDTSGNLYISGETYSTMNISYQGYQDSLWGSSSAFLIKFNPNGVREWGTYYGYNTGAVTPCATDSFGNVYLSGRAGSNGNIAFNGFQNSSGGSVDAFLSKFSSNGNRIWSTYYGGNQNEHATSCTTDAMGNVYISGSTNSPQNIADNGFLDSISTAGGDHGFLVKFDMNGQRQWGTYCSYYGYISVSECTADINGNVYIAGTTTNPNSIAQNGFQNTINGASDAFLSKFSAYGDRLWSTYFGGLGSDGASSCTSDYLGNVYLLGNTGSTNLPCDGYQDSMAGTFSHGYLAKFDPCKFWLEYSDTICDGSSYNFGSTTLYESGTYIDSLTNTQGCDSTVIIHLEVLPLPTIEIDYIIPSLVANSGFTSYQWSFNGDPLLGETMNWYTPEQNGIYGLMVSDLFGCSVSTSYDLINVSTNSIPNIQLYVYPNPTTYDLVIANTDEISLEINLCDANGNLLIYIPKSDEQIIRLNLQDIPSGSYFLNVVTEESLFKQLIIKN